VTEEEPEQKSVSSTAVFGSSQNKELQQGFRDLRFVPLVTHYA